MVLAWNYKVIRNSIQENPFIKVYWILHTFQVELYFLLPDYQLAEDMILLFVFYEKIKIDKSEFVAKVVGITVIILFI